MDGSPEPAPDCAPTHPGRAAAADAAAVALASGSTVKAAAKKAGIAERTLYGWMKRPGFAARVARLRMVLVNEAVGALSRDMSSAARALRSLLRSPKSDVKLRAAKAILELGVKAGEYAELDRRTAELEARLAGLEAATAGGGTR